MDYEFRTQISLDAIDSVKARAIQALNDGDYPQYAKLMADLYYLEHCLVSETRGLLESVKKAKRAA